MAVGHGQLGIRSGLRTFRDLVGLSQARRDSYIEIDAGLLADGAWDSDAGTWTIAPNLEFDDIPLDVTSCRTLDEVLTRVNTPAECVATAGTYNFFPASNFLRINLSGGIDPNDVSVLIVTTFGFTTSGQDHEHMVQPILGEEMLLNPDLEDWASSTDLDNYTEDLSGAGWAVTQDTATVYYGGSSAKLSATGAASGSAAFRQSPAVNLGAIQFRLCGYYQTPSWAPATQHVYIRYGTTAALSSDGRNNDSTLTDGVELAPTFGEWRFFCYDFIAHEASARLAFRLANGSAVASEAHFDKLSLRQIMGWRYYRPLVAQGGVPEVVQGASDIYPGSEETGSGQVRLINGPGDVMERMFSSPFFYPSREVRMIHGGVFPGGQEILYNDLQPGYGGVIAGEEALGVSDEEAFVNLEDHRSILSTQLPTRVYNETDQPNGESRDRGRPRPLVFGLRFHSRPSRIAYDGTTGYGVYEMCDTTDWAPGFGGAGPAAGGSVRAYPDEEAADKMDNARVVGLDPTVDYSTDSPTGTLAIHADVRVYEITREKNKIDFNVGAGPLAVTIPPGVYTIGDGTIGGAFRRGLLEVVSDEMTAVAGVNIDASYDQVGHLVTIQRLAKGALSLLWNTGVNAAFSIGTILGYDGGADDTGSLGYTADSVLFSDPDSTHIIRADMAGFQDDASGTYTGGPGDTLQKGSDVLCFILMEILKLPATRVDLPSFIAARGTFPATLGAYLGGLATINGGAGFDVTVQDVLDRLENGASADGVFLDIQLDGTGKFFYKARPAAALPTAPHLYDRDCITFRGFYAGDDAHAVTRVNYDQNPSTGVVQASELSFTDTILRFGRPQTKTFDTFLTQLADADACCGNLQILTRSPIRHFEITEPGKLLGSLVGDVILLTRVQALQGVGESGGLDADEFRIMSIRKNFDTGICVAVVATNLVP